ncbi:hypothetical protein THOM_0409 [Trachipleistophora hominis]|uniref:Uncharacterized protein n=1 Tax=Trachipleistophora hominis TaxID=72359 RepID=L7JZ21_TRAHO|nr:hypothetical protein THOM_0409 [Trachipleistophora hominis]
MLDNSGIYHRLEIINNQKTSCLYQLNSQNIWSYGASKHLSSSYIMKHSNLIRRCRVIRIYVDMLVMDCLSISSLLIITANSLLVLNLQEIDYLERKDIQW